MNRMISPCKGCADRTVDCHGKCQKYNAWKLAVLAEKRKEKEERDLARYDPWERESVIERGKRKHE